MVIGMNFLPFLLFWLINQGSTNELHSGTNDHSMDVGYCSSLWLNSRFSKQVSNGSSRKEYFPDACFKILLSHWTLIHPSFNVSTVTLSTGEERNGETEYTLPKESRLKLVENYWFQYLKALSRIDPDRRVRIRKHSAYDMKRPVETDPAQDIRRPIETDRTHDMRRPIQLPESHDHRWPVIEEPSNNLRNPLLEEDIFRIGLTEIEIKKLIDNYKELEDNGKHEIENDRTHDVRRPVGIDPAHDMRRPVETDRTHDMRRPVQLQESDSLRWPLIEEPSNDLRDNLLEEDTFRRGLTEIEIKKLIDNYKELEDNGKHDNEIENDRTHDVRRPVEIDPAHDMRRPMETDRSHDMRRPVQLQESHDHRWPVIEEPSHDLRNSLPEIDVFPRDLVEIEIKKLTENYNELEDNGKHHNSKNKSVDISQNGEILKCPETSLKSGHSSSSLSQGSRRIEGKSVLDVWNASHKECGKRVEKDHEEPYEWPWLVSLLEYTSDRYMLKCEGALLTNLWVVTAAHCVDRKEKSEFIVRLGHYGLKYRTSSRYSFQRNLDRIISHPMYNRAYLEHDIALIRMEESVPIVLDIFPICLPWNGGQLEGKTALAVGWIPTRPKTKEEYARGSDFSSFYHSSVPILMNSECEALLLKERNREELTSEDFLCAGTEDYDHEICGGHSGGPLAILDDSGRWSLIGIVSFNTFCYTEDGPKVYIRVSRYVQWIENTIACFDN